MKKLILLIEDDVSMIEIYNTVLTAAGFSVETMDTGEEAMERVRKIKTGAEKPDLVLLDLILPDMNGIDILEEIRKQEETKDLKVFILSNYSDEKLKELGTQMKVNKFLLKTDLTPSQLKEMVKEELGEGVGI